MATEQDLINMHLHGKKNRKGRRRNRSKNKNNTQSNISSTTNSTQSKSRRNKKRQRPVAPIVESRPHLGALQRYALIDGKKQCVSCNGDVPFTVTEDLPCFTRNFAPESASSFNVTVPRSDDQHKLVLGIENVFTEQECNDIIKLQEACGFGLIVAPRGKPMNPKESERTSVVIDTALEEIEIFPGRIVHSCRIQYNKLAHCITERIRPFLPEYVEQWGSFKGIVPETMAFLRYGPNEGGGVHRDSEYINKKENRRSRLSCMLYLNDNCQGGNFRFKNWDGQTDVDIDVGTGKVVVFEHDILHQGTKVFSGRKYAIKMDIEYESEFNAFPEEVAI